MTNFWKEEYKVGDEAGTFVSPCGTGTTREDSRLPGELGIEVIEPARQPRFTNDATFSTEEWSTDVGPDRAN